MFFYRYVPPIQLNEDSNLSDPSDTNHTLVFKYKRNPVFTFTVSRQNDPDSLIWDTSIGILISLLIITNHFLLNSFKSY